MKKEEFLINIQGTRKNKKYAMVAINDKIDKNNNHCIRRVLISYINKKIEKNKVIYKKTKLVAMDPYFSRLTSSHQYHFSDDAYILNNYKSEFKYTFQILNKKRSYHYYTNGIQPLEFEASSKNEAIKKFETRNEFID